MNNLISLIKKDLNKMDKNEYIRLYVDVFVSSYLSEENMKKYSFLITDCIKFLDEDKEKIKNDLNELLNEMENLLSFKITSYKNFLIALFNKLISVIKSNKLFIKFNENEINTIYDSNEKHWLFELEISNILLLTLYNYIEKNYEDLLESVDINDYFDIVMNDKIKKIFTTTNGTVSFSLLSLDFDGDILTLYQGRK